LFSVIPDLRNEHTVTVVRGPRPWVSWQIDQHRTKPVAELGPGHLDRNRKITIAAI
jgi:hypothetical protein